VVMKELGVRITARSAELDKALKDAEGKVQAVGRRLGNIGRGLTTRLTLPLVAVGAGAVKAFADFDSAMTKSTAIMGDLSDALRGEMVAAARDVGRTTTIASTQAAESFFFLASAGLDAKQSIAALPQVAAFAQAGMFDMAQATDLATDAQSALGLTAADAQKNLAGLKRVTDVLVRANTLANASVEQFSVALTSQAGAALKSFNIDMEEGVAVLAAFADQGVKGELAGNNLARILRLMAKAGVSNADALRKLGIEIFDAEGNMRNLGDIVANLETALGGMSDAQRTAALESIGFSARVQGALLPLLGTSDAIKEYEAGLRSAGGATAEVAANQLKSFSAGMTLAKNNVVIAAQVLGEVMAPVVLRLGEFIGRIAAKIEDINPTVLRFAVAIAGVTAAIGPLIWGLAATIKSFALLKAAFITMKVLVAATAASFGPIILAVGAVGAAAFVLIKNWDTARVRWQEIWLGLLIGTQKDVDRILDALEPLARAIPGVFGKLDGLRDQVGEKFTTAVRQSRQELTRLRRELADTGGEVGVSGPDADAFSFDLDEQMDELRAAFAAAGAAGAAGAQKVEKAMTGLQAALAASELRSQLLGDSFNLAAAKADAYRKAIDSLIEAGVDPASTSIQMLRRQLLLFSEQAVRTDALNAYRTKIEEAQRSQRLFGDTLSMVEVRAEALRARIEALTSAGISEQDDEVQRLVVTYGRLRDRLKEIDAQARRAEENRAFLRRVREDAAAAVQAAQDAARQLHTAQIVSGFEQAQEAAGRMADAMGGFFESIITRTDNVVAAFKNMVDGIIRELTRLVVQQQIVRPLFGVLSAAIPVPSAPGPIDLPAPPTLSLVGDPGGVQSVSGGASSFRAPAGGAGGSTLVVEAPVNVHVSAVDMRGAAAVADQIADVSAERVLERVERSRVARSRLFGGG